MTWRVLLFAHWEIPPGAAEPPLPDRLDVDTFEGDAYLGVVPFRTEVGPTELPFRLSSDELELRTYVRGPEGGRGVYSFDLEADDPLGVAVARRSFRLPYYRTETEGRRTDAGVYFRSRRTGDGAPPARFEAEYDPDGLVFTPEPGSLGAFLAAHYRIYTSDGSGRGYHGKIDHEPWSLRPRPGGRRGEHAVRGERVRPPPRPPDPPPRRADPGDRRAAPPDVTPTRGGRRRPGPTARRDATDAVPRPPRWVLSASGAEFRR